MTTSKPHAATTPLTPAQERKLNQMLTTQSGLIFRAVFLDQSHGAFPYLSPEIERGKAANLAQKINGVHQRYCALLGLSPFPWTAKIRPGENDLWKLEISLGGRGGAGTVRTVISAEAQNILKDIAGKKGEEQARAEGITLQANLADFEEDAPRPPGTTQLPGAQLPGEEA